MMTPEEDIKNRAEKTKLEVKWWTYLAWSLPLVALAAIFFFSTIGWETAFDKSIVIGAIIMFTIAVIWWWWAILKIFNFADMMSKTADRLSTIKSEFSRIKDTMKD